MREIYTVDQLESWLAEWSFKQGRVYCPIDELLIPMVRHLRNSHLLKGCSSEDSETLDGLFRLMIEPTTPTVHCRLKTEPTTEQVKRFCDVIFKHLGKTQLTVALILILVKHVGLPTPSYRLIPDAPVIKKTEVIDLSPVMTICGRLGIFETCPICGKGKARLDWSTGYYNECLACEVF